MSAADEIREGAGTEIIRPGRGRYPRITTDTWTKMLQAYSRHPTKANVMKEANVGEKLADRAINQGWPELDLLPFRQIVRDQQAIYASLGAYRRRESTIRLAQSEGTKALAQEGVAIESALANATLAGQLLEKVMQQVLNGVNAGNIKLPAVLDEKYLLALTRSAQSIAAAVEKVISARKLQGLKPEEPVGKEIASLLMHCTQEELAQIAQGGVLPRRLLGHASVVMPEREFEDEAPLPEELQGSTSDPMAMTK